MKIKTIKTLFVLLALLVAPLADARVGSGDHTQIMPRGTQRLIDRVATQVFRRDPQTWRHSRQVAVLAAMLARALYMPKEQVRLAAFAGAMHDVGKEDLHPILHKDGQPTDAEFALIKQHPQRGVQRLRDLAVANPVLFPPHTRDVVLDGVLYHHERMDGKGYPHKLPGKEIPRIARLLTVVDSFDAMTSNRKSRMVPGTNNKKAETTSKALNEAAEELLKYSGKQFDPEMANAFCKVVIPEIERAGGLEAFWAGSVELIERAPALVQSSRFTLPGFPVVRQPLGVGASM